VPQPRGDGEHGATRTLQREGHHPDHAPVEAVGELAGVAGEHQGGRTGHEGERTDRGGALGHLEDQPSRRHDLKP